MIPIYFVDTDKEEPKYYATTTFDDPELVNRLEDAGCEFGRVAEKEMNPILNFLLVWIVPILIFWGLGQLLSNYMMKKMVAAEKEIHLCPSGKAMPRSMWNLQSE